MTALLELENVRAGYGSTSVLHGVSLSVLEGQVVSLLGASGAGKTTTLRAITGGVRWTGDIRFAGRSLRRTGTTNGPEGSSRPRRGERPPDRWVPQPAASR